MHVKWLETDNMNRTGASRIFIFDHTIRRQPKDQRTAATFAAQLRGPVKRVHIDQSYTAALSRVSFHLPDEADKLLQNRYQIINVSFFFLVSILWLINTSIPLKNSLR